MVEQEVINSSSFHLKKPSFPEAVAIGIEKAVLTSRGVLGGAYAVVINAGVQTYRGEARRLRELKRLNNPL